MEYQKILTIIKWAYFKNKTRKSTLWFILWVKFYYSFYFATSLVLDYWCFSKDSIFTLELKQLLNDSFFLHPKKLCTTDYTSNFLSVPLERTTIAFLFPSYCLFFGGIWLNRSFPISLPWWRWLLMGGLSDWPSCPLNLSQEDFKRWLLGTHKYLAISPLECNC